MLTRKQKWRRVRCRPRQLAIVDKIPGALEMAGPDKKSDLVDSDSDEVSTITSAISTWSSFDSVESALEGQDELGEKNSQGEGEAEEHAGDVHEPGHAVDARAPVAPKGVTFEPRVQVFLVTHKSELDNRAKQALWWTGRDAAINKRAWLNHLGQPGCGRQSAARPPSSAHLFGTSDGGGLSRMENSNVGGVGGGFAPGFVRGETVGILGCRCQACLTEGDEYDYERPAPHQQQQQYGQGYGGVGGYNHEGCSPSSSTGRAASKSWPSPEDWERDEALEEEGSRSYSPASSHGSSPLREADAGGVFSASAYFLDRE